MQTSSRPLPGHAALKGWPELSRDTQEALFDAAVDDGVIANALATYLHYIHPGHAGLVVSTDNTIAPDGH
jgi:hypothetical protein